MNFTAINTIIIEDEKPSARRLKRLLEKEGFRHIELLHSVEEATVYFETHRQPELLFLDVQLSDGLSFELFDNVPKLQSSMVIFTTAYDSYALKAFDLKSIAYLLKPITPDDLNQALHKFDAFHQSDSSTTSSELLAIKQLLSHSKSETAQRFTVKIGHELKLITLDEIGLFSSQNKASYLHLAKSAKRYPLDDSLNDIDTRLSPDQFFRINRNVIVNIDHITKITVYSGHRLKVDLPHFSELKNQIVSRERVQEFKHWLKGRS